MLHLVPIDPAPSEFFEPYFLKLIFKVLVLSFGAGLTLNYQDVMLESTMIDPAQTALFIVIIVLTILLLILGIQVFFILRELRQTINKANKVLDDTGVITESVSGPISNLSTMASGLKVGSLIASILARKKSKKNRRDDDE